mgnify:CR=1 FL=1
MNIEETQLRAILKEQREEYLRYCNTVAEDVTLSLDLIAEKLFDLKKHLAVFIETISDLQR